MKICNVDGCGVKFYAKGLCATHYSRYKKGMPLILVVPKPNKPKYYQHCVIEGCDNQYYAKTYCKKHYNDILMNPIKKKRKCKAYQYCGLIAEAEYCSVHKKRITKNMSLDLSVKYTASGERSGNWKGGISEYKNHSLFKRNRLIKLEECNYICESCGKKAVLVHHIDKTKSNHSLDNLMALCAKCHLGIYHKGQCGRPRKMNKT